MLEKGEVGGRTDANMFSIDPLTVLVGILFGLFFIKIFRKSKGKSYENFPPGPNPCQSLLSKKYGPVFSVQIGSEKMVILCGYETVKDALVNYAEEFSDRPYIPIFQDLTRGYGSLAISRVRSSSRQEFLIHLFSVLCPDHTTRPDAALRPVAGPTDPSSFKSINHKFQNRILNTPKNTKVKNRSPQTENNSRVKQKDSPVSSLAVDGSEVNFFIFQES
ncbi:unnamed protein product [Ranitomeya imitator]|uniref:Uncharacterized protein n=1 Tax=Ranitomeya imitator TaxID=111125 RepID=A0ABN9L8T4_9NEOB|nr:unnamed protein product [Ranitomeya imitator]